MAKFTQTAGSAALYLSLLEPEDNYFFVPAEAKAWPPISAMTKTLAPRGL